jgi:hypothetical protein
MTKMQFIEPTKRVAIARLANVASSSASAGLTLAAAALHTLLTGEEPVQEHEFLAADDALADAIAGLPGSFATHLDFLGILHAKDAQLSQHRQRNVGAALRATSAKLGRLPTEEDFPSGHPVPLFSYAYWGGVAAWATGSPGRAQHPKGYWAERDKQIAAIRLVAARHPDIPLTHALLHAAGLHRLGLMLGAAELQSLADEAGIDRNLRYRQDGWWTAERVMDAYASRCRQAGVTLSTTALTALGGEACSLKSYAAAHFATFAAFQRAVVVRHPDIRPPGRPTAKDGTEMDSWSEVPVYDALCVALPDAHISVHVILPGEKRRSCDIVIDDRAYVEVLGIARSAMSVPISSHQAKYGAQWAAKSACYASLGIDPVVIEPEDVHDAARLAERVAHIAALLHCDAAPLPPPGGRSMRAKGSWDFDKLCSAVEEVAHGAGVMPTYEALSNAGFGHAASLLRQPVLRTRVIAALALADPHAKGQWTRDRIVAELAGWLSEHGHYPTNAVLRVSGLSRLCSARSRLWAGEMDALRALVAEKAGVIMTGRRAPDGSYTTIEQVAAALKPLATALGRMPTAKEAAAAGLGTAWAHASRRGGAASMARMLGVMSISPQRRTKAEMIDALAKVSAAIGDAKLTVTVIRSRLGSAGVAWVRKCGGMAAMKAALRAGSIRRDRAA